MEDNNEGELIVHYCPDCARQVLSVGRRRKPEHFINMIDQVGVEDLRRIGRNWSSEISKLLICHISSGRKMLDSKAAVAAIGSLKKLPSYSDIEIGLLDKDVRRLFSV